MRDELGVVLRYPSWRDGLEAELGSMRDELGVALRYPSWRDGLAAELG